MKDLSENGSLIFRDFELGVFDRLPEFRIIPGRMRPEKGRVRILESKNVIVRFELNYIGAAFAGQLDAGGRFKNDPQYFSGGYDELLIEEFHPGSMELSGRFYSFPHAVMLPTVRFTDTAGGRGRRLQLEFDLIPDEADEYMKFLNLELD